MSSVTIPLLQTLQLEIKQIQNEIKQHDSDKKNAERQMKENRARAEDARYLYFYKP